MRRGYPYDVRGTRVEVLVGTTVTHDLGTYGRLVWVSHLCVPVCVRVCILTVISSIVINLQMMYDP